MQNKQEKNFLVVAPKLCEVNEKTCNQYLDNWIFLCDAYSVKCGLISNNEK